jgi:predicted branched-subunit amino acid permease
MTMPQKLAYFSGTVAAVCPFWYIFTLVGALIGESIPDSLALDFAVPITFLALITPMLRSRAHVAAALVSIVMALLFAWLPFNLGLLVAGITAMMTGAEIERRTTLRSEGGA